LNNITDYLIEEASAEEEELLGLHSKSDENSELKVSFERDEGVLKVDVSFFGFKNIGIS